MHDASDVQRGREPPLKSSVAPGSAHTALCPHAPKVCAVRLRVHTPDWRMNPPPVRYSSTPVPLSPPLMLMVHSLPERGVRLQVWTVSGILVAPHPEVDWSDRQGMPPGHPIPDTYRTCPEGAASGGVTRHGLVGRRHSVTRSDTATRGRHARRRRPPTALSSVTVPPTAMSQPLSVAGAVPCSVKLPRATMQF